MKYYYSEESISRAVRRIKRFTTAKVYLTDHFAGRKDSVIEICGINENTKAGQQRIDKINKILSEELGEDAYLECYDFQDYVCYIGVDEDVNKGSKYDPIILDGRNENDYPTRVIWHVQQTWKRLSERDGDFGTCVIGEHFEFSLNGKYYHLEPLDALPGSAARERYVEPIRQVLKAEGCENIRFDYGIMD